MKYPVNVNEVKKIQSNIWQMISSTFALRKGKQGEPLPIFGHYGGVFQVGNEQLVMHCDGVGTKVLVAQALEKYDTVGIDAIAMNVNDIVCMGAEPLVGVDYLALAKEDDALVSEIMKGLVAGAQESNCAIIGGETAIVPELLKNDKTFDLTFTVIGRIIDKVITGQAIQKGDVLIGLESSGLHSNGYTLARKALDIKKWGKEMLVPTRIYVKPVLDVIAQHELHGIAHITGGAFSKLTRLNKEFGFSLNAMQKMPKIFEAINEKVNDVREMYRTFNCGIGMVLVAKKEDETGVKQLLTKHGVKNQTIGEITDKKGVWLEYENKNFELS
ncbi:phosphoribosylformylglycinamidine cyclo-ligase [Candidatus Micrarchaeota archaeon]|nr:phosphoribosylformylglycinamidine cyclo-ligase [Candidatus Micrarchaeota archaeon]